MSAPHSSDTTAAAPAGGGTRVLDVESLRVAFPVGERMVRVVDDLSFSVARGETVCLVGESGSGKSMTALSLIRLVPPPGRIEPGSGIRFLDRDLLQLGTEALRALRGDRIAMIFQEPMTALNPVLTVGDQVAEVVRVHRKLSRREATAHAVEMLTRVGIPDPAARARQYPHELSGGMRQRVMIAMALALDPDLVVADEPTTALDVTIQAQILDLLRTMSRERQLSLLLITHDLGVVAEMADRVLVMYAGRIVEEAPVATLFEAPGHPYTEGLLAAMPRLDEERTRLTTIRGTVPAPADWPTGCRFRDRCPYAFARCVVEEPALLEISAGHRARCHLVEEPGRRIATTATADGATS